MSELTPKQKEILQHTLGADSRYLKKQWGFRNRFCAGKGHSDYSTLQELVRAGFMVSSTWLDNEYFHATRAGAVAIGFKPYQLKNAGL